LEEILADGFKDNLDIRRSRKDWIGVWLSARILEQFEGGEGGEWLVIEIPDSVISDYEYLEGATPYREFLAPAELVNQYGAPTVVPRK
jgi:hypothetical protein